MTQFMYKKFQLTWSCESPRWARFYKLIFKQTINLEVCKRVRNFVCEGGHQG